MAFGKFLRVAGVKSAWLAAGSAFAISVSAAAPAFAQATDDEADDADDVIIVSARRREESLQDVPIAVSAFDAQQLDQLGVLDLTDIEAITPNVTLETSRGTNNTITAFIRGVGQQDPVAGFVAGVGIYIDDVYLNRPQAALLDVFDVERIEVLRGPQGTLYGRNTIGGAVKYVTRRLTDDPSAGLRVTGGNYGQFDAVGTFNLPVALDSSIGDLLVGGTIGYFKRNGFGVNLRNGLDNYDKDILAGRLAVEWKPTETLSFRVTGDWTDDNSNPRQGDRLVDFPGNPFVGLFEPFPVLENEFDTRAGLNTPEQSVVAKGISGVAEWQISETITLKNILAYREDFTESPIDFDALPIVDLDVPVIYDNSQFSEEFQLLYEGDRLSGIVGFYYLDANALNAFDVVLDTTATLLSFPGLNAFTSSDVDTSTWSIFADFTYDLTDTISLSVGGRYTEDERTIDLLRAQFFTPGLSPTFGGPDRAPDAILADLQAEANFEDFSPRASISWQPTDEHTFYFSYSQGFKGGSFDPRCGANAAPDLDGDGQPGATDIDDQIAFCSFDPEEVDTYEIGWKNNLFGGRFRSSLAFFYSDYKDVQVPGSVGGDAHNDGISETIAGVTTNAGAATIFGLEVEGVAILAEDFAATGDSLSYQFSLGYINAEFDEFVGRPPVGSGEPADLSDIAVFQNTPSITAFSRLQYDRPFDFLNQGGDLGVYTSVSYRSLTNQFSYEIAALDQEQFALLNAGIYWTRDDGKLNLSVHGTNLTDQRYIVAGYDFVSTLPEFGQSALGLTGVQTAFYGDPRRFMGTIEVRF
ncbi:MAG: TonB-dependent receptor [Pseudomonadota bacterium]